MPQLTMELSTLARIHADTLDTLACEQVAEFCRNVVDRWNYDMTPNELAPFQHAADGLEAILAMQSK